jgi:hypothetical protein
MKKILDRRIFEKVRGFTLLTDLTDLTDLNFWKGKRVYPSDRSDRSDFLGLRSRSRSFSKIGSNSAFQSTCIFWIVDLIRSDLPIHIWRTFRVMISENAGFQLRKIKLNYINFQAEYYSCLLVWQEPLTYTSRHNANHWLQLSHWVWNMKYEIDWIETGTKDRHSDQILKWNAIQIRSAK